MKIEIILALVLISVFVIDYLIKKKKSKSTSEIEKITENDTPNKKSLQNKSLFVGAFLLIFFLTGFLLNKTYFIFEDDDVSLYDYVKYSRVNIVDRSENTSAVIYCDFGNNGIVINGKKEGLFREWHPNGQISEIGKGPDKQAPSMGCSIKWFNN